MMIDSIKILLIIDLQQICSLLIFIFINDLELSTNKYIF